MKEHYVSSLRKNETKLSNDLVYDDIAPNLIQEELVTPEEHANIVNLPTEREKIKRLLEDLAEKNDQMFIKLVQVLCKDYSWLAQGLLEIDISTDETDLAAEPSTSQTSYQEQVKVKNTRKRKLKGKKVLKGKQTCLEEDRENRPETDSWRDTPNRTQDLAITNDMIKLVRRNYRVSKGWTCLAHSLGLSAQIHNIRVKVNTFVESEDMCIVYLLQEWTGLQPKAATLTNLITLLRNDEFNDVADQLEETFLN